MSDTGPFAAVRAKPFVEYRQFLLHSDEATRVLGTVQPDRMCHAEGHGVLCTTGGNDFHPDVRLEAWLYEPPEVSTAWEAVESVDFDCPTGRVRVRDWDYGPSCDAIDFGTTGTFRLRASCRGRAQAAARVGHDLYYEGVEEWLLQVWPVTTQKNR